MRVFVFLAILTTAAAIAEGVSYRTAGASVAKVVSALSEQSGEKLSVHKDIASEIVVVSVKDVDAKILREKLADCLSGKWVKRSDGVLELRVDDDLNSKRRREFQKALASAVPAKIKSTREIYGGTPVDAENAEWMASLQLLLDLIEMVPLSVFESLLPNTRTVLSTDPNRSQKQLGNVLDVVARHKPDARVKSVKLSVERGDHTHFVVSSLWVFEEDGKFHQATVGLFERNIEPPNEPGKTIDWSAASLELSKNFRGRDRRAEEGLLSLSQNLRDALAKPTVIDPVSFGFGEGMLAVAAEKGESLVASVADDDINGSLSYATPGMTTGNFWAYVNRRHTLVGHRKDGWIIVRPGDPIDARERRGDRAALEKLISRAEGRAWAALEDLLEFACSNLNCSSIPRSFSLPFQAMVNYYGKTNEGFANGFLRELQFFSLLGESQRTQLLSPSSLTVSQLNPRARSILAAYFFEPSDTIPSTLAVEPTSVMPNGLPPDLKVSAVRADSSLFCPLPDAGEATMPSRGKSAADFAREKWVRRNSNDPDSQVAPEPIRVRLGSRTLWEIDFVMGNQVYATFKIADDTVPVTAKPMLITDLPADARRELDRAYEEFVKAIGGGG